VTAAISNAAAVKATAAMSAAATVEAAPAVFRVRLIDPHNMVCLFLPVPMP
jgi:hypothetical protein